MNKKLIKIAAAVSSIGMFCTACTSASSAAKKTDVSEETMRSDIKSYLNEHEYEVDEISEFTYETGVFSEEEKQMLSGQFTQKTTIHKFNCSFRTRSVERDIKGECSAIYAYINNGWSLVKITPENEDTWTYTAKDTVSTKKIREDLAEIEFPNLGGVTIGNEVDTAIEITERKSDIENGNDNVDLKLTYNADFAVYEIGIKLMYKFEKGDWVLSSHAIDDEDFWVITFDETKKPQEPKEELIVNKLSDSSNYKNYMINQSYVDNYYITREKETVRGSTINYNYVLIVTYNEVGDIEYNISKPYTWTDNSWKEGELEVSVRNADFEKFLGTWASTNGDFVRFTNVEDYSLFGTYTHKYADGNYVTYNVTGKIDLELIDNNWDLTIEQDKVVAGEEEEHFVILPFKINLADDTLTSNGNIYVAKGNEDGGPGFTLNEDGSYFEEKPEDDDEMPKDDDYDSGLDFFSDSYKEESEENEKEENE